MAGGVFSGAKLHAMTIRESATDGSDFTNPDADYRRLFLGEDGFLHVKDSAGAVTDPYDTSSSGIPSGTSFPGGPSSNDLFYRTDRDLLYFYDGTRWLTLNLYDSSGDTISNASTTTDIGRWPAKTSIHGGIFVETFYLSVFIATTNNGTNFWTFTAQRVDSSNTATTLGSTVNTSGDSANTWVEKTIAVAAVLDTSARQVQIQATKTLSPGNLYSASSYTFRWIG